MRGKVIDIDKSGDFCFDKEVSATKCEQIHCIKWVLYWAVYHVHSPESGLPSQVQCGYLHSCTYATIILANEGCWQSQRPRNSCTSFLGENRQFLSKLVLMKYSRWPYFVFPPPFINYQVALFYIESIESSSRMRS